MENGRTMENGRIMENSRTMERSEVKAELGRELDRIRLSEAMKDKIRMAAGAESCGKNCGNNYGRNDRAESERMRSDQAGTERINMLKKKKAMYQRILRTAAAFAAVVVLGGTTVYAGYRFLNRINVNDQTLPELDSMKVIDVPAFPGEPDECGLIDADYSSYDEVNGLLGNCFLDSDLEGENPYMQVNVYTDNKDFGIISVENYLVGDTDDYQLVEDVGRYNCDPGAVYSSSVSLKVSYMLSTEQEENGWDSDYLGYYEYLDSYVSSAGYRVNLIGSTTNTDPHFVTEKTAVFVADGVRYELQGRVSMETLKEIVDSMKSSS